MFRIFREKLTRKQLVISNRGFHSVWNNLVQSSSDFQYQLYFSKKNYNTIMSNLLEVAKNGSQVDELYNCIYKTLGFPAQQQFMIKADEYVDAVNRQKKETFDKSKRNLIADRFSVNNIEDSINQAKEKGLWEEN
jgi:hypothetical protein